MHLVQNSDVMLYLYISIHRSVVWDKQKKAKQNNWRTSSRLIDESLFSFSEINIHMRLLIRFLLLFIPLASSSCTFVYDRVEGRLIKLIIYMCNIYYMHKPKNWHSGTEMIRCVHMWRNTRLLFTKYYKCTCSYIYKYTLDFCLQILFSGKILLGCNL